MAAMDSMMQCTLGGSGFQLLSYEAREAPILQEGFGRIGTEWSVSGEGWVESASIGGLAAALAAARTAFRVSGVDVTIYGQGGQAGGNAELVIAASGCWDGGPHVEFTMTNEPGELRRKFKFQITAKGGSYNAIRKKTATRPDDLRTFAWTGEARGSTAATAFANAVTAAQAAYPWPDYVLSTEAEYSPDNTRCTYSISIVELNDSLPSNGGDKSVEGTASTQIDEDEAQRRTTTKTYNLLVVGDPESIRAGITPAGKVLLKESWTVTAITEVRLTASFTWLESSADDDLVNWQQTLTISHETTPLKSIEYEATTPIVIYGPQTSVRATQKGSATGIGKWVKPAAAISGWEGKLESRPQIDYQTSGKGIERVTTWQYVYVFDTGVAETKAILDGLLRPETPAFWEDPA